MNHRRDLWLILFANLVLVALGVVAAGAKHAGLAALGAAVAGGACGYLGAGLLRERDRRRAAAVVSINGAAALAVTANGRTS